MLESRIQDLLNFRNQDTFITPCVGFLALRWSLLVEKTAIQTKDMSETGEKSLQQIKKIGTKTEWQNQTESVCGCKTKVRKSHSKLT